MQAGCSFQFSLVLSHRILTKERVFNALKAYFSDNYITHVFENDPYYQKRGVDLWVVTKSGLVGVDLKASSTPVDEALNLEVYSVREKRKLGYLLREDSLCAYVLFIDASGKWRMFRRDLLARALRQNFGHWADRFGVNKQRTRCAGPGRSDYTSSTLKIPTTWVRGAYYRQAEEQS